MGLDTLTSRPSSEKGILPASKFNKHFRKTIRDNRRESLFAGEKQHNFSQSETTRARELKAQKLSAIERLSLNNIPEELQFLVEKGIDNLVGFEKDLYSSLLNLVDPGCMEAKLFTDPGTLEPIELAPLAVLNRDALISATSEKIRNKKGGYREDSHLNIFVLDLAHLRKSDYVQDALNASQNQLTYADILIHQSLQALSDLVDNIDLYVDQPDGTKPKIQLGRLGGDEFAINITGTQDATYLAKVEELLQSRIQHIEAFYLENQSPKRRAAMIKNNHVERYTVPEPGIRRDIFLHYFDSVLVFDDTQIDAVLEKYTDEENNLNEDSLRQDLMLEKNNSNIYGSEGLSNKEKIEFLYLNYKEDGVAAARALNYDKRHGTNTFDAEIKMIENVLYDSLLRDRVQKFPRFKEHLSTNTYQKTWGKDLKFIKEINDDISMAGADFGIIKLFAKIKQSIQPEDKHKLTFTRKGGTYFISHLRDSGEIENPLTVQLLEELESVTILNSAKNLKGTNLPVGKASADLRDQDLSDPADMKAFLENFYRQMEISFYSEIINDIMEMDFDSQMNNHDKRSKYYLVFRFFTGKRKQERVGMLIDFINEGSITGINLDDRELVVERVQELLEYSTVETTKRTEKDLSDDLIEHKARPGFDFSKLSQFSTKKFGNYPLDIQLASLLTFENGPKTIQDIQDFFIASGTIYPVPSKDEINKLLTVYHRFQTLTEPIQYSINSWAQDNIRKILKFDDFQIGKLIFDCKHSLAAKEAIASFHFNEQSSIDLDGIDEFNIMNTNHSDLTVEDFIKQKPTSSKKKNKLDDLDNFDFRNI